MSKVNQIQSELRALSGAAFQKLVEHYLAKVGHSPLYPIGSVAGADKTKTGTPDALAISDDGRYILFEHTTQCDSVAEKFADDLAKGLNETKTGIAVEKIDRVVLCSTSDLSPAEIDGLRELAQNAGVKLDVIGLQDLSYELLTKYPGLARDHLGVEVDTGQILPPDEFVVAYGANRLAPPLDTGFIYREDEVAEILQALDASDLVVVAGPAGVGKSRLALEACARYADQHRDCTVRCLYNRGAEIYEDLRVHLAEPGRIVLLVDDANRLSSFDYVVQLVAEQREDQIIKVVATVRDYAADRVLDAARALGGHGHVLLNPFSDDQIKGLAREEFEILNGEYLDRIAWLAQGNPRLAVMAARVAVEEQNLAALQDATHLYEAYFASVRDDLKVQGDLVEEDLLRVAGIIGFFGVVDRTNSGQMGAITDAFGISPAEFWASAKTLHDLEVLDMYEREVVKPSDQILSTYLVYLAFFGERILDVSALLACFFPARMSRFVDTLNPILSALDDQGVVEVLKPAVQEALARAEVAGDENRVLHLVDHFAPLIPTKTLYVAKQAVEATDGVVLDPDEVSYAPDSNLGSPSVLSILASFSEFEENVVRLAVSLLLDYVTKRPDAMPKVVHVLSEIYGPRHDSYRYGFQAQRAVVSELRSRASSDPVLIGRLLLAVAGQYLRCHFNNTSSYKSDRLLLYSFDMPPTPESKALRVEVWEGVLDLYRETRLKEDVENLVRSYAMNARLGALDELIAADSGAVLPFLETEMETDLLLSCVAAQDILDFFEDHGIEVSPKLRERFTTEAYTVLDVLLTDRRELRAEGLSYEQIQERRKAEIHELTSTFEAEDYAWLLKTVGQVLSVVHQNQGAYQVHSAVDLVLQDLARKGPDLLERVLDSYLGEGERLRLQHVPIDEFVQAMGRERTLRVLSKHDFDAKPGWLLAYYAALSEYAIRDEDAEAVVELFRHADLGYLGGRGLDTLLRFQEVRPRIVPEVVSVILDRHGEDSAAPQVLGDLFTPYGQMAEALKAVFANDIPLLRRAFRVVAKHTKPGGHGGEAVDQILDLDPDFIDDFVDSFRTDGSYPRWGGDDRDYSFLWRRDDHEALVTRIVQRFADVDYARMMVRHSFLQTVFATRDDKDTGDQIRERQDATLRRIVEQFSTDEMVMGVVSALATGFDADRRRALTTVFIRVNRDFAVFRNLELVSSMTVSWGDGGMVGAHLAKADYLDSLLPLLDDVDLLEHKMHVEKLARRERRWAEDAKRDAFARL